MEKTLSGEFKLSGAAGESEPEKTATRHHIIHTPIHFYSSYGTHPENISFQEQANGETIELFLRRHFITNLPWILFSIILAILPIFFPLIFESFPFPPPSATISAIMLAFYYVFIFGFILLEFTLWYFHIAFATNIRVVDIDITGILFRDVAEAANRDIEDVSYHQIGFIRSLFNFGDIHLQTSGSMQNIEFDRVPKPAQAARTVGDLTHKAPHKEK